MKHMSSKRIPSQVIEVLQGLPKGMKLHVAHWLLSSAVADEDVAYDLLNNYWLQNEVVGKQQVVEMLLHRKEEYTAEIAEALDREIKGFLAGAAFQDFKSMESARGDIAKSVFGSYDTPRMRKARVAAEALLGPNGLNIRKPHEAVRELVGAVLDQMRHDWTPAISNAFGPAPRFRFKR